MLKKLILIIGLAVLFPLCDANALNTNTTSLTRADSEHWSIADASQTGLDLAGDYSIEAWIKLDQLPSTPNDGMGIVDKTVAGDAGYRFQLANTNKLMLTIWDGSGGYDRITTDSEISQTATWIHVAATQDVSAGSGGMIIYVNGSATTTSSASDTATGLSGNAGALGVGALTVTGGAQDFFDGDIDDVRIWDDIRTAEEISANYNCRLQGDEAGLVAYWRFDNNGNDDTSNSNNLTNNNSVTFQSASLPFTDDCSGVNGNSYTTSLEADDSEYWSIADASQTGLDGTGDFATGFWVYYNTLPQYNDEGGIVGLVGKFDGDNDADSRNGWRLRSVQGNLRVEYSDQIANGTVFIYNNVFTATSTWYHIYTSVDVSAQDIRTVINGSGVNPSSISKVSTAIGANSAPFSIGCLNADTTPDRFVDGYIDDVRVYNTFLATSTMQADYNCRLDGDEANLVGYWTFDNNGNGQTSNANNLTNNNSATFQSASLPYTDICSAAGVVAGYFNSCVINL